MKYFVIILFFICSNLDASKITLGTGEWAPFVSKNIKDFGFVAEIVKEAFKVENIDVEFRFTPWKRCEEDLKKNKVTAIFPYSRNEDRKRKFSCSDTIFLTNTHFFALKKLNFKFMSFSSLDTYKVAAISGFSETELLKSKNIKLDLSQNYKQVIQKMLLGRNEVILTNNVAFEYHLKRFFSDKEKYFEMIPTVIETNSNVLLFNNNNIDSQKYLKIFNSGLAKIKANGKYQEILNKHMITL